MANTRADFSTSPTIELELEDVVYAAAAGNSGAFKALLQLDSLRPLVPILLKAGIYEKLRDEAERVASQALTYNLRCQSAQTPKTPQPQLNASRWRDRGEGGPAPGNSDTVTPPRLPVDRAVACGL
jgi:hypothetical protein